jgi:hypothetical protein
MIEREKLADVTRARSHVGENPDKRRLAIACANSPAIVFRMIVSRFDFRAAAGIFNSFLTNIQR